MARRRTLDRRALRDANDAAERREDEEPVDEEQDEEEEAEDEDEEAEESESEGGDEDEEGEPKPKPKKKKAVKPKAPAKPRSRAAKVVRQKVVWVVFDNSNKEVQTFPFPDRASADELVTRLATEKKQTFFVQAVRKPMDEK